MLHYTLQLALRGLRRYPRITLLSVLALALGMGTTITAQTVARLLAGNPLPGRDGGLYTVGLAPPADALMAVRKVWFDGHRPNVLTWMDVKQLQAARPEVMQTAVVNTGDLTVAAVAGQRAEPVSGIEGLEVQADFFTMFGVPLVAGHAWTGADAAASAPVAVISRDLANTLFAGARAVGQVVLINGHSFRVVGVSGRWHPQPHFYGLRACVYACPREQVFIPVSSARSLEIPWYRRSMGESACSGRAPDAANCAYLGFWVLLPDAAQRSDYRRMLAHYAARQIAVGRLASGAPEASRLQGVRAYLKAQQVVPVSVRFGFWVAVAFLLVCLTNVAGLLLTRFMQGARELGLRRALGASRREVFAQSLFEAGLIGLLGGVLALPLVWAGLWLVAQQPVAYASVIGMDWCVGLALLVLSVAASAVVGVLPAWRACRVEPGLQMKRV